MHLYRCDVGLHLVTSRIEDMVVTVLTYLQISILTHILHAVLEIDTTFY